MAIVAVAYGMTIQLLTHSELIVLMFSCTCAHADEAESHSQSSWDIPTCHNSPNIAHVCSCKNGDMVKKINEFLYGHQYIDTSQGFIYRTYVHKEMYQLPMGTHSIEIPNSIDKPPKQT